MGLGKHWIKYENDDGNTREAIVEVVTKTDNYLEFKTDSSNIITLPWSRIIKLKRKEVGK